MRLYAAGVDGDTPVVSGESGAATLGCAALLLTRPELADVKEAMGLSSESVMLFFNTEGDTYPKGYREIVTEGCYPLPDQSWADRD